MNFVKNPYFLTFAPQNAKKISYSSSFGIDYLPDVYKRQYREWLLSYSFLSVRESTGVTIVEDLLGVRPSLVTDPVFLLTSEKWRGFERPVDTIKKHGFIFLYMLHYNEQFLRYSSQIANEKSVPLFVVLSENRDIDERDVIQLKTIGPNEWLWLIDNAEMVITSSFHGSAFSVIFNTPLTILMQEGIDTNTRVFELINRLDIRHNKKNINEKFFACEVQGYSKEKLNNIIGDSVQYLSKAI